MKSLVYGLTCIVVIGGLLSFPLTSVKAQDTETCYQGICFPAGDVSFADIVLRYDPNYSNGCAPWHPDHIEPDESLGPPNYVWPTGCVALGTGGLLEVGFTDNTLTNSGDSFYDLHIFEVGGAIEESYIAVRPGNAAIASLLSAAGLVDANGDGFFEVGRIHGSTASIDLDSWAPGFVAGELRFDAVQIIDVLAHDPACHQTAGADIDAVGAIATAGPVPTENATWGMVKALYQQ